jgi:hypothetical protein
MVDQAELRYFSSRVKPGVHGKLIGSSIDAVRRAFGKKMAKNGDVSNGKMTYSRDNTSGSQNNMLA